ncbi:MAG: RNA polymerase sigma factor [Myxococcales bacterium]|nr:RNA polymerase sigma factor [Myxococcales bacterium]
MPLDEAALTVLLRRETPHVVAHLAKLVRDLSLAEELLQDTVVASVEQWRKTGLPPNPGAYLMKAARNRAIDVFRRQQREADWTRREAREAGSSHEAIDEGAMFADERLRLVFTCCHPGLPLESQIALTLRLVCGLTTPEVARAFLVPEPTIAQRLVRAKRSISDQAIGYEEPEPDQLDARLDAVLHVFLAVFNEGHTATSGDALTRVDLMDEAQRLTSLVVDALPDEPEARGLLALMQLQASRADARVDSSGALVLLEDQDRATWNHALIERGLDNLQLAAARGRPGRFQLHAHIAATHARAPNFAATDWARIGHLYRALELLAPSPIVTLNRAVAVAMVDGPEAGLALLAPLEHQPALRTYHLLPATRADLLRRLGRLDEARAAYLRALELVTNSAERSFLERRLAQLAPGG